jgi:hypothetical protein
LWPFGTFSVHWVFFYGHLWYFVVILYISPILVCCTKKNLATLEWTTLTRWCACCLALFLRFLCSNDDTRLITQKEAFGWKWMTSFSKQRQEKTQKTFVSSSSSSHF